MSSCIEGALKLAMGNLHTKRLTPLGYILQLCKRLFSLEVSRAVELSSWELSEVAKLKVRVGRAELGMKVFKELKDLKDSEKGNDLFEFAQPFLRLHLPTRPKSK